MTYKFVITDYFKKQLKSYAKKDPELKQNLIEILKIFKKEQAVSLGHGVYKLRLKKNGKGKSAGYRLIVLILETGNVIAPICIFAKSERSNITLIELTRHLKYANESLSNY